MAFVTNTRGRDHSLVDSIAAWMTATGERLARYRVYRRTLDELSMLSNRELADLGISRSGITAIAHDAAYGEVHGK